jgi:glucose-6-phosphate 1-dehydrogenase
VIFGITGDLARKKTFRSLYRLTEDVKVANRLTELLEETKSSGKQVHDANVIATMLVHGVDTVVTLNTGDFARFSQHVHVAGLPGQE